MTPTVGQIANATYKFRATFYAVAPWEKPLARLEDVPEVINSNFPTFFAYLLVETIVILAAYPRSKSRTPLFEMNDTITSFSSGVLSRLPDLFMNSVEVLVYVWFYDRFHIFELPLDSVVTWIIAVLGTDLGFYWFHRAAHEVNILWFFHQGHHSSEYYNISTAFRKGAFQRTASSLFYLPMAFFIPPPMFALHVQLNLIYQIWIHTQLVDKLWWPLEYILNTASHHRVHHGRNPYCIDRNYAGFLVIWDRIFGTFQPELEEEPVVYGLVHNLKSFDPIYIQLNHLQFIAKRVFRASSLIEAVKIIFYGPGWNKKKPELRLGDRNDLPQIEAKPIPFNPPCPMWIQVYCSLHFTVLALWLGRVLDQPGNLPLPVAIVVAFVTVVTACSFGNFFNRRDWLSAKFEVARCLTFGIGTPWLFAACGFKQPQIHFAFQSFFLLSTAPFLYHEIGDMAPAVANATFNLRTFFYAIMPWEVDLDSSMKSVPQLVNTSYQVFIGLIVLEAVYLCIFSSNPRRRIQLNDSVASMSAGIMSLLPDLFYRSIEVASYVFVYEWLHLYEMPLDKTSTWIFTMVALDCGYYFFHRAAHEISLFWAMHVAHHSSEYYNLTTATRQAVLQKWVSFMFYLPLALIVPPPMFALHLQLNLLFQMWLHTEVITKLWWPLEFIFNTPCHHRVHHGRNPYCIDKNYAGLFIIWDRLFGTFQEERVDEPVVYGLVCKPTTFDPLQIQFSHFCDIWSRLQRSKSVSESLKILFYGPGWKKEKPDFRVTDPADVPVPSPSEAKFNPEIPVAQRIYCAAHFTLITLGSGELFKLEASQRPVWPVGIAAAAIFICSAVSLGNIFNKRSYAAGFEVFRCAILVFAVPWLCSVCFTTAGGVLWAINIFYFISALFWLTRNSDNKED